MSSDNRKKRSGRPKGKIPCDGAMIAFKVGVKFREEVNATAKLAGTSARQLILRAIEKEMERLNRKRKATQS